MAWFDSEYSVYDLHKIYVMQSGSSLVPLCILISSLYIAYWGWDIVHYRSISFLFEGGGQNLKIWDEICHSIHILPLFFLFLCPGTEVKIVAITKQIKASINMTTARSQMKKILIYIYQDAVTNMTLKNYNNKNKKDRKRDFFTWQRKQEKKKGMKLTTISL